MLLQLFSGVLTFAVEFCCHILATVSKRDSEKIAEVWMAENIGSVSVTGTMIQNSSYPFFINFSCIFLMCKEFLQ